MKYQLEIDCPGDSFATMPGKLAPAMAARIVLRLADGKGTTGKWEKNEAGDAISTLVHDSDGQVVGKITWYQPQ